MYSSGSLALYTCHVKTHKKKKKKKKIKVQDSLCIVNQEDYFTCLVKQHFQQFQDPWKGIQEHHSPPCGK